MEGETAASDSESDWTVSPCDDGEQVFDEKDRVGAMHPIYNIPQQRADNIRKYFASKQGF